MSQNTIKSLLFRVDDIKEAMSLAYKLAAQEDIMSQRLYGRLDPATLQLLKECVVAKEINEHFVSAITADLNSLLPGECLYDSSDFKRGVGKWKGETAHLFMQNPTGKKLILLNRLLLEDAYRLELSRTRIQRYRQRLQWQINNVQEALRARLWSLKKYWLSPRALIWRWEALRTGRPFGHIVLLHTLIWRVEQVYLIHRSSGLLLQHVAEAGVISVYPDLVASMLKAITSLVHDSFASSDLDNQLDTLETGERIVWIERGSKAILAVVIRGNAPPALRETFREVLRKIHIEQNAALLDYENEEICESFRPYLKTCLLHQYE